MWIITSAAVLLAAYGSSSAAYEWKTPAANLARGLVSHGDTARLRAAMHRWKKGSPLKIGFLGGSVTEGMYCDANHDRIQTLFGEPHSWPQWTEIVLRENLPSNKTGGNISIANGAISATSSDYFCLCHSRRLPKDVDVVFLEMAINDLKDSRYRTGGVPSKQHKSFEKLLRSCLKYPHRPAVIVMNQYDFYRGCNSTRGFGGTIEEAYVRVGVDNLYADIARWYDCQALSVRSAVFDLMLKGSDGFRLDRPVIAGYCYTEYRRIHNESDVWNVTFAPHSFYRDDAPHPGCLTGGRVLGELAAKTMLDAFASLSSTPLSAEEEKLAEAPSLPPLTHDDLPPPVYENNYDIEGRNTCLLGSDLEKLAVNVNGWTWTDESRKKWGWVGNSTGAVIEMKIPAIAAHHSFRQNKSQAPMVGVDIDFLASYDRMGVAQLDCVSGCHCPRMKIDASHENHYSMSDAITIAVTEDENCVLRFTITNETTSKVKGHKFKLVGFTILPEILEGAVGQRSYTHGDIDQTT